MKEKSIKITSAFLGLLNVLSILACSARADETAFNRVEKAKNIPVLSLRNAISEALENNALLEFSHAEETVKEARIEQSGALPDPSLEASLTNYPVSSLSSRQSGMTGNEVMLVQKFPFPGKRDRMKEMAVNDFDTSRKESERTKLDLIRSVKVSYLDLSLSHKKKDLIQEQLKLLRSLQAIANNRYSLGTTPQTDVLDLQVKSAALLIKLEEEEKKISAFRAELNHLLGSNSHLSPWKPEVLKESKVAFPSLISMLNEEATLTENPKIGSLKSMVKAANSKVALTDLNNYPDFQVGIGYMQRFRNQDDNGADLISARVTIDLPMFQRSKHSEEQREAKAEKRKVEALLREGTIELSHNLHETIAELTETTNKLEIYRKALLPLTDASITSARKAYEINEAPYLTVLSLINSRYEVEADYFSTLVQHERAVATFESLVVGANRNSETQGGTH